MKFVHILVAVTLAAGLVITQSVGIVFAQDKETHDKKRCGHNDVSWLNLASNIIENDNIAAIAESQG